MGEWIENSVNNLCPCRELFFSQLDSQSFMTKDSAPLISNLDVRMCFYLNSTRIIPQANRQTDRHEDTITSNKKNKKKENKNKKNK